jgi:hypothetical protein
MRDRKALFAVTTLALLLPIRLMPLLFSACQSGTTGLLRPLSVTTGFAEDAGVDADEHGVY